METRQKLLIKRRRINNLFYILISAFLVLSCKQDKIKYLTGGACKYWDLYEIRPKGHTPEKRKSVSLLFCEDGKYAFYYIKNGKRIKEKYTESHHDMIPTNKWIYKNDTLLVDGMSTYVLISLKPDTLVLRNSSDNVYIFTSGNG